MFTFLCTTTLIVVHNLAATIRTLGFGGASGTKAYFLSTKTIQICQNVQFCPLSMDNGVWWGKWDQSLLSFNKASFKFAKIFLVLKEMLYPFLNGSTLCATRHALQISQMHVTQRIATFYKNNCCILLLLLQLEKEQNIESFKVWFLSFFLFLPNFGFFNQQVDNPCNLVHRLNQC